MSHLCSTNIVISSAPFSGLQRPTRSILANSPVLDSLLPQLSVWQKKEPKLKRYLENVDPYMLQETEQLLERVGKVCLKLGLSDSTTFIIKLTKPALHISGEFEQKRQLAKLVAQDRWIGSAFNWLYGNYSALANSQELISFSLDYENNRHQALEKYSHIELTNHGMNCYVSRSIVRGNAELNWLVESPVHVYHLKNKDEKVKPQLIGE